MMKLNKKDKIFLQKYIKEVEKVMNIYIEVQNLLENEFPNNGSCSMYGGWGVCSKCPVHSVYSSCNQCLVTTRLDRSSLKKEDFEKDKNKLFERVEVPPSKIGTNEECKCIEKQKELIKGMLHLSLISSKNTKKMKKLNEENVYARRLFTSYMGDLYRDNFINFFKQFKKEVERAEVI